MENKLKLILKLVQLKQFFPTGIPTTTTAQFVVGVILSMTQKYYYYIVIKSELILNNSISITTPDNGNIDNLTYTHIFPTTIITKC